ncbi:hypothetical protein Tco_0296689 [Tanacetum coccineum]
MSEICSLARLRQKIILDYGFFYGFSGISNGCVKSAFLYGTIEEEVYVTQPPGFKDPDHPTIVLARWVKHCMRLHQHQEHGRYYGVALYACGPAFKVYSKDITTATDKIRMSKNCDGCQFFGKIGLISWQMQEANLGCHLIQLEAELFVLLLVCWDKYSRSNHCIGL